MIYLAHYNYRGELQPSPCEVIRQFKDGTTRVRERATGDVYDVGVRDEYENGHLFYADEAAFVPQRSNPNE